MIITETRLKGALVIDLERLEDERGFFARSWCRDEFRAHGLDFEIAQCNISFNHRTGTLRGMHYQVKPYEETKLVRCTKGAIYDVIIDLRARSSTLNHWIAVELTESNHRMLYIPKGFAHGFQTLADRTEVFYQMSENYHAEAARGMAWNDPKFNIQWPFSDPIMSTKDRSYRWQSQKSSPFEQESEGFPP